MSEFYPCGRCGKEHDTSRCPDAADFGRRGEALKKWRKMAATKGAVGKHSATRIDRLLKEIRDGR